VAEAGSPELSVVCKSCGSEVSPYVTECPYCGTRIRKRAPKLERVEGEVRVREGRKERRARKQAERRARLAARAEAATAEDFTVRPLVTVATLAAAAILLVVERASNLGIYDLGAIDGPVNGDWWRYLAAPFVYDDLGYLFVCGLGIAIFLPAIERRVGAVGALLLVLGCGALGMLGASGIETALSDELFLAAGGNGIALGVLAAWLVIRDAERRADPTEEYDVIAVVIALVVLLLLPIVDDFANPWAGLVGGLVGGSCGFAAAMGGRSRA
jgi:membrane associated rhomboid family serine protease